jgi:uncharacterized protein YrrD
MKLEDLRTGVSVVSHDGHKLGSLSRFVINKDSHKLTHIVIDTGILRSGEPLWKGGWGLSHDRTVPLGALESATSDEVRVTMTAEEFRDHSVDYIEEQYAPIEDDSPNRTTLGDVARLSSVFPGGLGPYFMYDVEAKGPNEVEIRKDSPVWRLQPHKKIGEVERVLFDETSKEVTGLVMRRGFAFTKDLVLPMRYVVEVVADIVRVDIDDKSLAALAEFKAQD